MRLGINLSFAVKRWPEPRAWAAFVRDDLELDLVQFTFDLLDPWWPDPIRLEQAARVGDAARDAGIEIHSAQIGLAWYAYDGLLHPEPDLRAVAETWWERAIEVAAAIGARAVGGPVGAMTVSSADDAERAARFHGLVAALDRLATRARAAGLDALLVEPTPVAREIPSSPTESATLAEALTGTDVPVRYVLDVGHALYAPLYGEGVGLDEWLRPLAPYIGVLHVQNHDRHADAHWGWPDDRGRFDVAAFAGSVRAAGLDALPCFIELFHPFEAKDEEVARHVATSVKHCRAALAS